MQKRYYLYDENGFYLEPMPPIDLPDTFGETEESTTQIPDNATDIRPPDGLYRAKFNIQTQVWEESASQKENNQNLSVNQYQMPSTEERLNAVEDMLLANMFGGGVNANG